MKENNVIYLEKDYQGSTRVILNNNNEVVSSYDYDVFGNQTDNEVSEGTPYLYTGQEFDEETKLYNYKARMYDSILMRFYSVDPAEEQASPYTYCKNNPIMLVDPDGCETKPSDNNSQDQKATTILSLAVDCIDTFNKGIGHSKLKASLITVQMADGLMKGRGNLFSKEFDEKLGSITVDNTASAIAGSKLVNKFSIKFGDFAVKKLPTCTPVALRTVTQVGLRFSFLATGGVICGYATKATYTYITDREKFNRTMNYNKNYLNNIFNK